MKLQKTISYEYFIERWFFCVILKNMKISKLVEQENLKPQIVISVRNFVEFLLSAGDIDEGRGGRIQTEAMQEGSRIHRKLQRRAGAGYHAEVPLKHIISYEEYELALEGRADGIIYDEDQLLEKKVTIDEIKGMYLDVESLEEPIEVHLAQAKCYAYMFAEKNHLEEISVQMTYCNLDTEEIKRFYQDYSVQQLEEWFLNLVSRYIKWSDYLYSHRKIRQQSIGSLKFPFSYRRGQKELVGDVYRSISRSKILFIQAPTGTGKTLATIYPAVQALGQNYGEKIFYLTAKTATGLVARDAFLLLEQRGYQGKTVVITAKDKMCLLEERECTPESCPYAKGHFDRVNDAVYDFLQQENVMDQQAILSWAKERRVCPFEFSLDLSNWVDHIICDYNYVFDPNVYLKRFFAEGTRRDYLFLVDEAHNLVDRAREMYSETLIKEEFLEMKKLLKPYGNKLERSLERCNRELLQMKRQCEQMEMVKDMDALLFSLFQLATAFDELFQRDIVLPERQRVLDFYFKIRNFIYLSDYYDEHYRLYSDYNSSKEFCLHLFCVDPSLMLQERIDRARSCIFFSATLLPIQYYKELLCNEQDVYAIYAEPVFEQSQRALLIGTDVTSKYTRRNPAEYAKYADYILSIIANKKGNYMVFCPSYKMMQEIHSYFLAKSLGEYDVLIQESNMSENSRREFLKEFEVEREKTLVAFCVMGGIFSEGIDLTKEKLIGAVIVGVGLPQIGNEREVMRSYFQETKGQGFAFAYLYPGMNKVIQAAGRVIRTAEDAGVIALLDERFSQAAYRSVFPREWEDASVCDVTTVGQRVKEFWNQL